MNNYDPVDIATLIARMVQGTIRPEEQDALDRWLDSDEANRDMFMRITDPARIRRQFLRHQTYDHSHIRERVSGIIKGQGSRPTVLMRRRRLIAGFSAAAAILLVVTAGWLLNVTDSTQSPENLHDFFPDGKTAILETSDGRRISLDAGEKMSLVTDDVMIRNDSGGLSYDYAKNIAGAPLHKIITPSGGEYSITLSDGTKVWLNCETELSYPSVFGDGDRIVYLAGEAYFEVAKSGSGFEVRTNGIILSVLGTSFNVKAYPDEDHVAATLVSGSVGVSSGGSGQMTKISPGEQAVAYTGEGRIEVSRVDTDDYTGWKDDLLVFNNESMINIARKLSRWYGVEIEIESPVIEVMRFYGVMQKYESISKILDILKETCPIEYEIRTDKVMIKPR